VQRRRGQVPAHARTVLALNPAVSEDCIDNFWAGHAYCVDVSGEPSPTPASPGGPTPTDGGGGGVEVPSPVQEENAVENCSGYAQALEADDWCAKFAERNGISTGDLYAWNKVLGENGSNCNTMFWASYWYCVAVSD
jgi:hypothetical protein